MSKIVQNLILRLPECVATPLLKNYIKIIVTWNGKTNHFSRTPFVMCKWTRKFVFSLLSVWRCRI